VFFASNSSDEEDWEIRTNSEVMMRILVQPEHLRQVGEELHRAQESWQAQAARLRSLLAGLDWEIRQKANVDAQVQEAIRLAEELAARNGESAAFLETAAARF